MRERTVLDGLVVALVVVGCATTRVDPRPDHERARAQIEQATGQGEVFDPAAPLLSGAEIETVLGDGLELREALRLALLNNRRLQAGFAGLGVARAEFVQAGLLANPSLSLAFLFASGGGRPKIALDLTQSIVELWELPQRQAAAGAALEQRIVELSRFAGLLVADTEAAYFESVASDELVGAAREALELTRSSLQSAEQRVAAGVATITEDNLARSQTLSAELALGRAQREASLAKRRLASLLSLEIDLAGVELIDGLPDPFVPELDTDALIARSVAQRLDVRAADAALETARAEVALEHRRAFPNVAVGIGAERPERGASVDLLVGPTASIELPIFDDNRARLARAEYRRDQLAKEREALVAEVTQQVRSAVDQASATARAARFVEGELVPHAQRGVDLARTAYDLGDTTVLVLIEAQRAALAARQSRIDSRLEAVRAKIDVERAAGMPWASLAGETAASTRP